MSLLQLKLSAMAKKAPVSSPAKMRAGLLVRTAREAADPGLFELSEDAVRRMGLVHQKDVRRLLFLDTETTGLSGGVGTIAFVVGMGYLEGQDFVVEQLMMRDYSDEPELLARVAERLRGCDVVVSFNGKSFDMPLLESRFTFNRMRSDWIERDQWDLLFPARTLWKRRLGSCKLSNLEEKVLRRGREHDLPGSEVPGRFFEYMKTGDEELLEDVLLHNYLDIVSLGALLVSLDQAFSSPSRQLEIADLFSLGVAMERRGEPDEAMRCYRVAQIPRVASSITALRGARYENEARMALSLIHKRMGEYQEAEKIWQWMVERGQLAHRPLVELAIYYEHKLRQYARALAATDEAIRRADDPISRLALEKRKARLTAKCNKINGGL